MLSKLKAKATLVPSAIQHFEHPVSIENNIVSLESNLIQCYETNRDEARLVNHNIASLSSIDAVTAIGGTLYFMSAGRLGVVDLEANHSHRAKAPPCPVVRAVSMNPVVVDGQDYLLLFCQTGTTDRTTYQAMLYSVQQSRWYIPAHLARISPIGVLGPFVVCTSGSSKVTLHPVTATPDHSAMFVGNAIAAIPVDCSRVISHVVGHHTAQTVCTDTTLVAKFGNEVYAIDYRNSKKRREAQCPHGAVLCLVADRPALVSESAASFLDPSSGLWTCNAGLTNWDERARCPILTLKKVDLAAPAIATLLERLRALPDGHFARVNLVDCGVNSTLLAQCKRVAAFVKVDRPTTVSGSCPVVDKLVVGDTSGRSAVTTVPCRTLTVPETLTVYDSETIVVYTTGPLPPPLLLQCLDLGTLTGIRFSHPTPPANPKAFYESAFAFLKTALTRPTLSSLEIPDLDPGLAMDAPALRSAFTGVTGHLNSMLLGTANFIFLRDGVLTVDMQKSHVADFSCPLALKCLMSGRVKMVTARLAKQYSFGEALLDAASSQAFVEEVDIVFVDPETHIYRPPAGSFCKRVRFGLMSLSDGVLSFDAPARQTSVHTDYSAFITWARSVYGIRAIAIRAPVANDAISAADIKAALSASIVLEVNNPAITSRYDALDRMNAVDRLETRLASLEEHVKANTTAIEHVRAELDKGVGRGGSDLGKLKQQLEEAQLEIGILHRAVRDSAAVVDLLAENEEA
ncbi:hypothetical protein J8273_0141 [Carpediemonas membranifera]|uniref:Uncharacterized protein n=1 Tax=Carpediemonas membranifera TaxID=201153 RepID=A0A8J6AV35_9EUKA|nr:hypothetical protein J8273_0141 [Carpediemonas membranifera]|eukprot:KAG9394933.1 hypothetical protein J8273_0141 [Carpediemonas membranifera]